MRVDQAELKRVQDQLATRLVEFDVAGTAKGGKGGIPAEEVSVLCERAGIRLGCAIGCASRLSTCLVPRKTRE